MVAVDSRGTRWDDADMDVLVVDGANVVGSVPDGWWRDRAGAAARLHAGLVAADLPYEVVELVLEGAARAGVPESSEGSESSAGSESTVTTVHAAGSGDDEIVHRCAGHAAMGDRVVVVTADRELIERVGAHGATTIGPKELRRGLPR